MKSLADQLREQLANPKDKKDVAALKEKKPKSKTPEPAILTAMIAYDNSQNKSMVHARFDERTVRTMNQIKMAANIDVTKFVAFAVKHLLDTYPELKTIIKQFIQNSEL